MAESAIITAVINKAVEIGAKPLVQTGSRLYHLKEDIEWIKSKMRHFKSCLKDAELKRDRSYEVANLINGMRDLALDIEDILDTYLSEIESHQGKRPFRFVQRASCILCYGATANAVALEIEKIKRRAQEIEATRERCHINLDADGGNADMDVWDRRKNFLVAPESIFVGRKDTLQEVKEKLRSSDLDCKMICIVGDAGVGKTTVGKNIYKEVQSEFTSSALVYVSNEPRVPELLLEIAKQVGLEKEKMDENLEVNLRSLLNGKRCLIFLDDIWTTEAWDDLKDIIPMNSRNCSRIIITSRNTHVGRCIGGESSLIELKLLDQEKSWELFSESMKSSSENMSEIFPPIELEDIAKKIVERCGGLPLAIVVVVGMLRQRRRDKHAWKGVLDSFSTSVVNKCSDILSLSYKDLSPDLRPFFLYFGLFPEDKEILVSDLCKAWIAEKLIQDDGNQNPDDIADAKLDMLSDRNLIQVSRRDLDGRLISCRIHDLLHVFCIETAKENNFYFTCHNIGSNSFKTLHRLIIDNISQYSFSNSKTPKLRTLLYFSKKESLIPNEIGNLSSLTCLKLSGTFKRMPSTIRNLKKLVTLDIGEAEFRFQLPRTILRMKHLKHLLLPYGAMFESNICTKLNVRNESSAGAVGPLPKSALDTARIAPSLWLLEGVQVFNFSLSIAVLMSDVIMAEKASCCPKLKELDVSYCYQISHKSLATIGSHCPNLHILRRNLMNWVDPSQHVGIVPYEYLNAYPQDGDLEVATIGKFMPRLLQLELQFSKLTGKGLALLSEGCRDLEYIDLSGCRRVPRHAIAYASSNLKNLKNIKQPNFYSPRTGKEVVERFTVELSKLLVIEPDLVHFVFSGCYKELVICTKGLGCVNLLEVIIDEIIDELRNINDPSLNRILRLQISFAFQLGFSLIPEANIYGGLGKSMKLLRVCLGLSFAKCSNFSYSTYALGNSSLEEGIENGISTYHHTG
ncbi:disease resistance RPP13-like [Olea europaea subsp. europaea]|uniref:Disease resistance RPP13-like n=1 Tax=Olea europaea subsp. europaea TaxID=158383 RepID=A0A8S0R9M6_OLEEU|nr:disease resistance RPP13-like [Olea europaea subsp. europaea]